MLEIINKTKQYGHVIFSKIKLFCINDIVYDIYSSLLDNKIIKKLIFNIRLMSF